MACNRGLANRIFVIAQFGNVILPKLPPKPILAAAVLAVIASCGLAIAGPPLPRQAAPVAKGPLFQGVLEHQHANDRELDAFERCEHRQLRDHGADPVATTDKTSRLVPTGAGWARIELADHGKPVDPATMHNELVQVERSLEDAVAGTSADAKNEKEKIQRRHNDRSEILNAIMSAFIFTKVGTETINGHETVKYHLDPDPNYKPHSRTTEFLKHATATMWLDENAGQVARVEATVASDVSILGILAKVYRGGHIFMEQSEIEPGVWLPTYYQADFAGRKLFSIFEVHEKMETYNYKRVGGPAESLAMIRREMASNTAVRP